MKFYILLLALVWAVAEVKSDFKEEMHKIDMACRAESHVSESTIKDFFHGEQKGEPVDALKCHMKCLMEKQGHWKNGGFDVDAALKDVQKMPHFKDHENDIKKIFDECKDKKGASECDTAYLITECIVEHYPDNGKE